MKKTMALMLSLMLAITMFVGSGLASETALFTPGTYTGEGTGFGGQIVVEVEVNENEILSITATEHAESAGISDGAFEKIPAAILENQSVAVDTVAGCTFSSNGLIEAVTAALALTCTDMEQVTIPVEAEKAGDLVEKSADVVIIGAGGAGMSAAVEVLKAGSSVIVIEKMPQAGGNTILAGSAYNTNNPTTQNEQTMLDSEMEKINDILALEPQNDLMIEWQATLQEEITAYTEAGSTYLFDSPSLHKLQTYYGGDYVANPELLDVLFDKSLEGFEFLTELGSEWEPTVNAAVGATWRRSHTPTTKYGMAGTGFIVPQIQYAEENGAEMLYEHKATELIMTDGKITGVKGEMTNGTPFIVSANKAVILATGGFGANVEMRESYNTHWSTLDATVPTTNHAGATGDGIVMAEAIGAELVGMDWIQLIPTYGPGVFTAYIENQFYVNKEGNRFVREDGRRDELSAAILEQTDSMIYIISDANTVKDRTLAIADYLLGNGYVYKADTLEELAEQIGMPYENLVASMAQYNEARSEGNDPFGRQVFDAEFGVAPFYAGLTGPMVHHTMGGVEINVNTQVLDADGNIIPGLYAAGEVTGGIHGSNRLGGNAIADIIVYGRIAGQNAAAEVAAE